MDCSWLLGSSQLMACWQRQKQLCSLCSIPLYSLRLFQGAPQGDTSQYRVAGQSVILLAGDLVESGHPSALVSPKRSTSVAAMFPSAVTHHTPVCPQDMP